MGSLWHYVAQSMWTPSRYTYMWLWTSHCNTMCKYTGSTLPGCRDLLKFILISEVVVTIYTKGTKKKRSKCAYLDAPPVVKTWENNLYGGPMCQHARTLDKVPSRITLKWRKHDAVPYRLLYMLEKNWHSFTMNTSQHSARWWPTACSPFNFVPLRKPKRWWMVLRSGNCTGQVFTHLGNHFYFALGLCVGTLSCWKKRGFCLNCCLVVLFKTEVSAVTLACSLIRAEEAYHNPLKTAPDQTYKKRLWAGVSTFVILYKMHNSSKITDWILHTSCQGLRLSFY